MRILIVPLVAVGFVWTGACRPPEPTTKDVSPAPPVGEGPAQQGEREPAPRPGEAEAEPGETAPAGEAMEPPTARTWDFEDAEVGSVPSGWSVARTGEGPGSEWQVLEDESAPAGSKVLGQVSMEGPRPMFCLCIADDTAYTDVDLSVAFKGVQGKIDQGGGPVWRLQDENNYYITRMNPLESNFRLYKVIDGKRTQLASADVEIPDEEAGTDDPLLGKWHTIRVVHRGNQIECTLNGELRLQFEDDSIPGAGKVGLWAKADAVTSFDNLTVAPPSE